MTTPDRVERLLKTLLYEGYAIYPYRKSALKNARRWLIGALEVGQAVRMQVLIAGPASARLEVEVRFLHPRGDEWQEVDERAAVVPKVSLAALVAAPVALELSWPADASRAQLEVRLTLELSAEPVTSETGDPGFRVTARARNATAAEADPQQRNALASAHLLVRVSGGAVVSLIDPAACWAVAASACRQEGVWPILAGEPGDASVAIASPIILYDHPEVAPESPGDLFDATEIDEILTLRILTLTDDEKREMRATDPRARQLLDRTEALGPEALRGLHGALRDPRGGHHRGALAHASLVAPALRPGDHVRVRPRRRADAMDLMLDGKAATVASLERDFEGRVHVAVTVDEDPGRDLGEHAHRFFFAPDELERVPGLEEETA